MNIYLYKDKHEVSNAINILNSNIDGKICKNTHDSAVEASASDLTKCSKGNGSTSKGFSAWFDTQNTDWNTPAKKAEKWHAHNAKVVSDDTAALTREEKGVVSSVFAKVIEGAEIL